MALAKSGGKAPAAGNGDTSRLVTGGYYADEGWEVIVVNPSFEGRQYVEVYVVALADRETAEKKIRAQIDSAAVIKEFVRIAPGEMQQHQLYQGRWAKIR